MHDAVTGGLATRCTAQDLTHIMGVVLFLPCPHKLKNNSHTLQTALLQTALQGSHSELSEERESKVDNDKRDKHKLSTVAIPLQFHPRERK